MRLLFAVFMLCIAADTQTVRAESQPADRVIAVVNGLSISQGDLDRLMKSRGVSKAARRALREKMLQELIDAKLIAGELKRQKVKADPITLDRQLRAFFNGIRKTGNDPQEVLRKIGHSTESFKAELALTLAWQRYARGVIPAAEIRAVFDKERSRYDGTRVRARQIVLKLPPKADDQAKQYLLDRLSAIRLEIANRKTTFAAAAKLHSTAPSKDKGGDLGFFTYGGRRVSVHLSRAAFTLKGKEISEPFVTPFGVHILQVTDRRAGQLSLEDARPEIFKRLSTERWKSTAKRLRETAKIDRK